MIAGLADAVTTLALCWRIERSDGVAIGLTAHDRTLTVDGFIYKAAPGMTPSAIEREAGLSPAAIEVSGALGHAAISEADLIAGRWDDAQVTLIAVDWRDPDGGTVALMRGTIGAVSMGEGGFTAELRGAGAGLEAPAAEETSPSCRAELGDRRCRVAMAGRRRMARVTAAADAVLTLDVAEQVADQWGGGAIRWITGPNGGLTDRIARSGTSEVTLWQPPRFDPVGARIEIVEGCDKRIETCQTRFANAANFRGEPYLPGMDLLTRYPGA